MDQTEVSYNYDTVNTKAQHITVGKLGEAVAEQYFRARGHKVLDRNYQRPWGEIDLITVRGGRVFFLEVKTVAHGSSVELERYRKDASYSPEQHVDKQKKLKLSRIIESWRAAHKIDVPMQIDVVAVHVIQSEKRAVVNVFSNIDLYG